MKEKVSYQFSGEMRSPWLPLAKHEISMRSFKADDVLRRQMLYRLSADGFQETLSFSDLAVRQNSRSNQAAATIW